MLRRAKLNCFLDFVELEPTTYPKTRLHRVKRYTLESIVTVKQGWAIALFEKERIPLFFAKKSKKIAKEQLALFALFRSF